LRELAKALSSDAKQKISSCEVLAGTNEAKYTTLCYLALAQNRDDYNRPTVLIECGYGSTQGSAVDNVEEATKPYKEVFAKVKVALDRATDKKRETKTSAARNSKPIKTAPVQPKPVPRRPSTPVSLTGNFANRSQHAASYSAETAVRPRSNGTLGSRFETAPAAPVLPRLSRSGRGGRININPSDFPNRDSLNSDIGLAGASAQLVENNASGSRPRPRLAPKEANTSDSQDLRMQAKMQPIEPAASLATLCGYDNLTKRWNPDYGLFSRTLVRDIDELGTVKNIETGHKSWGKVRPVYVEWDGGTKGWTKCLISAYALPVPKVQINRRRMAQREHSNRRDSPVMVRLLQEIIAAQDK